MRQIVSIHSFRGGTGKSNVTANVASQVAAMGKRVAIVDTDIQSPGIHVLFGLDENTMGHTLNQFLRDECKIEDVAFRVGGSASPAAGLAMLKDANLWLVPSSINGGEIARILREGYDINRMNEGLQTLLEVLDLDYLFIDTHPGLNENTLLSVAISDILIIIMRPDNQDFQGTAVTVDIARSLDVPHLFLLVNKALTRYDFNQIKTQVEQTYDTVVGAVLPLSEDMVDLASSDIFSLRFPDHLWSQGIIAMAKMVVEADN